MENVFWIIPGRLAGRPGPTAAPWDLAALRRSFDSVINISEYPHRAEDLDAAGFEHTWVPLPPIAPPNADVEQVCLDHLPRLEAHLQAALDEGRRVLVHCVSGKDRTGMLLAYHVALADDLTARDAIGALRRVRPIALNAPGWEEMALRVIDRLLAGSPPREYVATVAHASNYPNPIRFSVGDPVVLRRNDERYPGWIWIETESGNAGWAPESLVRIVSDRHGMALANYTARELNTTVGERVSVLRELSGWLWVQNGEGETGWIPKESARRVP